MHNRKFLSAIHEAGHALALHDEGRKVNAVTLDPPATKYRRYTVYKWEDTVSHLFCIMAGRGAHFYHLGESLKNLQYGGTDAFQTAKILDNWSRRDQKILVEQAIKKTENWLEKNYPRVERFAYALYKHKHLDHEDLEILLYP